MRGRYGPAAGLAILDGLAGRDGGAGPLTGHYRLDAVRAHLLEMAGDRAGAVTHYRAAPPAPPTPPSSST